MSSPFTGTVIGAECFRRAHHCVRVQVMMYQGHHIAAQFIASRGGEDTWFDRTRRYTPPALRGRLHSECLFPEYCMLTSLKKKEYYSCTEGRDNLLPNRRYYISRGIYCHCSVFRDSVYREMRRKFYFDGTTGRTRGQFRCVCCFHLRPRCLRGVEDSRLLNNAVSLPFVEMSLRPLNGHGVGPKKFSFYLPRQTASVDPV